MERCSDRSVRGTGMTDEEISRLSLPELIELLKRIADEIEIREMQKLI